MAGIGVETERGSGRRNTDAEVHLIPMIDLFVVCISFLLITAVWSQMSRLQATAQVPSSDGPTPVTTETQKRLWVDMRLDDRFVLRWQAGRTVLAQQDVVRRDVDQSDGDEASVRYPDLAQAIARQWQEHGSHTGEGDTERDQAVVQAPNRARFSDLVAVIDAVYATKRSVGGTRAEAFQVTLASD